MNIMIFTDTFLRTLQAIQLMWPALNEAALNGHYCVLLLKSYNIYIKFNH